MEFNEKLQELRKRKGLTQEQLAESLYVSRTAVSKWESGRGYPNIDSLKRVADFFSVTIDDLLSDSDIPAAEEEKTEPEAPPFSRRIFALLDLSAILLLFLPFFGQASAEGIRGVSLLALTGISPLIRGIYFGVLAGMTAAGILTLLPAVGRHPVRLSLSLNAAGMLVFILSPQPYAAAFLFLLLAVKAFFLPQKP